MKTLRVVLVIFGIYALLHVTTQSLRHAYVAMIEPRTSVLTKFDSVKEQIASSENVDQLLKEYESAKAKVDEWKVGKTNQEIHQAEYSDDGPPYTARMLREAIERWEARERKLFELHFFWWSGVACLIAGIGCWRRIHPWLGAALFIVAFGEMIYWTTPEFRRWSDNDEFTRLVLWKLFYSTATLAMLLGMWIKLLIPLLAANSAQPTGMST